MTVVYLLLPWSKGLMSCASPSGFVWTISSAPISFAMRSRCAIISRNFQVVSMCISGKGNAAGANAFCARRSITELSLPIE